MLDVKSTYNTLNDLNDTISQISNLDYAYRHAGNPLYRIYPPMWHSISAMIVGVIALIHAIVYAANLHQFWLLQFFSGIIAFVVLVVVFEFFLTVAWIVVHFVFYIVKCARRKNKEVLQLKEQLSYERAELLDKANSIKLKLNDSVVPTAYCSLSIVEKLCSYIDNRRASNIQEAINLYELEKFQQQQLAQTTEMNQRITKLEKRITKNERAIGRAQRSADMATFLSLLK